VREVGKWGEILQSLGVPATASDENDTGGSSLGYFEWLQTLLNINDVSRLKLKYFPSFLVEKSFNRSQRPRAKESIAGGVHAASKAATNKCFHHSALRRGCHSPRLMICLVSVWSGTHVGAGVCQRRNMSAQLPGLSLWGNGTVSELDGDSPLWETCPPGVASGLARPECSGTGGGISLLSPQIKISNWLAPTAAATCRRSYRSSDGVEEAPWYFTPPRRIEAVEAWGTGRMVLPAGRLPIHTTNSIPPTPTLHYFYSKGGGVTRLFAKMPYAGAPNNKKRVI